MEVEYPETAYMIMMFLGKVGPEIVAPLDPIYETAKQGIMGLERNQKKIEKIDGKMKIIGATIIQMKFRKEIELKREYWTKSSNENLWRYKLFNNMDFMKNPKLYQYMVVPSHFDDKIKEWKLSVSNPFFISDDNDAIEKYILASNEGVDERAKSAATYTVEKMWGINWETKEVKEVEDDFMMDEIKKEEMN